MAMADAAAASINAGSSAVDAEAAVMEAHRYKYSVFGCFHRKFRNTVHEPPDRVCEVFEQFSANGVMSVAQFHDFLVKFQGEADASLADAQRVFESVREGWHRRVFQRHDLGLDDFFRYVFSLEHNSSLVSDKVHHDMNAPLSHYFMFTGHNSYLTGNQLNSKCSDTPIIHALQQGVRVIELDLWPNQKKSDIHVLHGRTLTVPVAFIKCIKAIKDHAFHKTDFPVIITLENHLPDDLQEKAAKMITDTFGEMLYCPVSEDFFQNFPSPESLRGKVIVSTKRPTHSLETNSSDISKESQKNNEEEIDPWGEEIDDQMDKLPSEKKLENDDHGNGRKDEDEEENMADKNAVPEFKKIIAIRAEKMKGQSCKDILRVDGNHVKRVSLSETQLEKAVSSYPRHVVRFTQRNLLRVYPKGTRVTSSNFNPLKAWTHGAQMVALNMQGRGRPLWLAHGLFRANGGCGYVKKPDFLLFNDVSGSDEIVFSPKAKRPIKTTLKIKILIGDGWNKDFKKTYFDRCSPPDFYTRVGIAGVRADSKMKKTKIKNDTWTPTWNEEFEFPLTVPELALLRVEVHEHDDYPEKDVFAGQTCLPVSELKSGLRTIPLHKRNGEQLKYSRLLAIIQFVQP